MPIGQWFRKNLFQDEAERERKARQAQVDNYLLEDAQQEARLGHLIGEFKEKLCDGQTYYGLRWWNFRTIPRSVTLGRRVAPWCPRPWSKRRAA